MSIIPTSSLLFACLNSLQITFSNEFRAHFSSWHCGPSMVVCQNICLATSRIKLSAVFKNDQLMDHLFGNTYDVVSVNKTVSQLYQVGHISLHYCLLCYLQALPRSTSSIRSAVPVLPFLLMLFSTPSIYL